MGALLNQWILSLSGAMVITTGALQAARDFSKQQELLQKMMQPSQIESSEPANVSNSNKHPLLEQTNIDFDHLTWKNSSAFSLNKTLLQKDFPTSMLSEQKSIAISDAKSLLQQFAEITPPMETLFSAVRDGGDIITGGELAKAMERGKVESEAAIDRSYHTSQQDLHVHSLKEESPYQTTYRLKPNITYRSGNGVYTTNENGVITSWSADLSGTPAHAARNQSHQKNVLRKEKGNHGGHFIAG